MHHETTRQALRNAYINGANMETAAAVRALGVLTAFTAERYPQHAAALAEIIEPFGEVLEKEFK